MVFACANRKLGETFDDNTKIDERDTADCGCPSFWIWVFAKNNAGAGMDDGWQRRSDCFGKVISSFSFLFLFNCLRWNSEGIDNEEMDISGTALLGKDGLSLCMYSILSLANAFSDDKQFFRSIKIV